MSKRRLIEDWLPIAALSAEATRERRIAMAGNILPPTTYLHVWFARRPLVASRAAVLGSLMDADCDRAEFLHKLGIHGDPVLAGSLLEEARRTGNRIADPHGYPRAWRYTPEPTASDSFVLDPTAGGGSIPLESARLGFATIANDLNPVASLLLKATVELPSKFGSALLARYKVLSAEFLRPS
jgi:putative DNA methylase